MQNIQPQGFATTDLNLPSKLMFWQKRGVKNQGTANPKMGVSFPLLVLTVSSKRRTRLCRKTVQVEYGTVVVRLICHSNRPSRL